METGLLCILVRYPFVLQQHAQSDLRTTSNAITLCHLSPPKAQTSSQAIQSTDSTNYLYSVLDYDAYASCMHHNKILVSLPEGTISTNHPPPPTLFDESGGFSPPHPLFSLKNFVQHGFGVRSLVFASETAGLGNERKSGDVENEEEGAL